MSVLTDSDKQRLRSLGVTDAQVRKLARKLPSIRRALSKSPARNDVMEVLDRAEKAAAELVKIANAASLPANREALAHLASASALVECEPADDSGDGSLPEVPDFGASVRMLLDMTQKAKDEVRKGQRRGRSEPWRAVALLLAALNEPDDAKSQAFAARVKPTHRTDSIFGRIAGIVLGCAGEGRALGLRDAVDAWRKRPMKGEELLLAVAMCVQSGGSANTP